MEREEEIEKAAAKFDGSMDCVGCFIGGAEWADQHPRKGLVDIENACQKLEKCMYDNLMFQGRLHRKEAIETFIEDFKKHLEEQV